MKKQKGYDYSRLIIWSSALVGMIRYAAAFLAADLGRITGWLSELVTLSLGFSGFAMGILGTLGTTYLFDGWRKKIPASGQKWGNKFIALTGFVFSAMVAEILILVPFTMSRVEHVSVADVLQGGVWWWSTAVVVMPFLLIGGVATGNQVVAEHASEAANEVANGSANGSQSAESSQAGSRTFASLSASDKYYIVNTDSKTAASELKVTPRSIQKWRKTIQEEITAGKL